LAGCSDLNHGATVTILATGHGEVIFAEKRNATPIPVIRFQHRTAFSPGAASRGRILTYGSGSLSVALLA